MEPKDWISAICTVIITVVVVAIAIQMSLVTRRAERLNEEAFREWKKRQSEGEDWKGDD